MLYHFITLNLTLPFQDISWEIEFLSRSKNLVLLFHRLYSNGSYDLHGRNYSRNRGEGVRRNYSSTLCLLLYWNDLHRFFHTRVHTASFCVSSVYNFCKKRAQLGGLHFNSPLLHRTNIPRRNSAYICSAASFKGSKSIKACPPLRRHQNHLFGAFNKRKWTLLSHFLLVHCHHIFRQPHTLRRGNRGQGRKLQRRIWLDPAQRLVGGGHNEQRGLWWLLPYNMARENHWQPLYHVVHVGSSSAHDCYHIQSNENISRVYSEREQDRVTKTDGRKQEDWQFKL